MQLHGRLTLRTVGRLTGQYCTHFDSSGWLERFKWFKEIDGPKLDATEANFDDNDKISKTFPPLHTQICSKISSTFCKNLAEILNFGNFNGILQNLLHKKNTHFFKATFEFFR